MSVLSELSEDIAKIMAAPLPPAATVFSGLGEVAPEQVAEFEAGWRNMNTSGRRVTTPASLEPPRHWLVWSDFWHAWHRAKFCGYTNHLDLAGHFTREEAMQYDGGDRNRAIHFSGQAVVAAAAIEAHEVAIDRLRKIAAVIVPEGANGR